MKCARYIELSVIIFISIFYVCYTGANEHETVPFLPELPKQWTKITPGPTHFMGRDLVPTCSGYPGTDSTFSFYVREGSTDNLVVYFEGGGG